MSILVLLCTCPADAADRLAETVVGEGLAACVNRIDGVQSVYRWQGALERGVESLLLIKTAATQYAALAQRLRTLHPYTVPEIIALPVAAGAADYLDWVLRESTPQA